MNYMDIQIDTYYYYYNFSRKKIQISFNKTVAGLTQCKHQYYSDKLTCGWWRLILAQS